MGLGKWLGDTWNSFVEANREGAKKWEAERNEPPSGFFTPKNPRYSTPFVKKAPAHTPDLASAPTQRYLREVGWKGASPLRGDQSFTDFGVDPKTVVEYGAHSYKLTPWQMEQAELDYGFEAPGEAPQLKGDVHRAGDISQEAWDKLTPWQQNAVQWNTLLTQAVEQDRKAAAAGAVADNEGYGAQVAKMFGTEGGSKVYAPATVGLLEKSGLTNLRGQDLDEYLSLDRAFTVDEIRGLQSWDTVPVPEYKYEGFAKAREAATAQQLDLIQLEKVGKTLDKARTDTSLPGWDESSRLRGLFGQPLAPDWPTTFRTKEELEDDDTAGPVELMSALYWDTFRDKQYSTADSLNQFWIDSDALGLSEEDVQQVFDRLFQQSFVQPVGNDTYLSGEELRRVLGMEA